MQPDLTARSFNWQANYCQGEWGSNSHKGEAGSIFWIFPRRGDKLYFTILFRSQATFCIL